MAQKLITMADVTALLDQALTPVMDYITELQQAHQPEGQSEHIEKRLTSMGYAADHIKHAKNLLSMPHESRRYAAEGTPYYLRLEDRGTPALLLVKEPEPERIELTEHGTWPDNRNIAFTLLEKHRNHDYAALWHTAFETTYMNKLPTSTWVIPWHQVETWVELHDWR